MLFYGSFCPDFTSDISETSVKSGSRFDMDHNQVFERPVSRILSLVARPTSNWCREAVQTSRIQNDAINTRHKGEFSLELQSWLKEYCGRIDSLQTLMEDCSCWRCAWSQNNWCRRGQSSAAATHCTDSSGKQLDCCFLVCRYIRVKAGFSFILAIC